MRDVVEHEPPPSSRGRRGLAVAVGFVGAALIVSRLVNAGEPAPEPPPTAADEPSPAAAAPSREGPGRPIASAPAGLRGIELVAVSQLGVYHGSLGDGWGRYASTGGEAYETPEVTVVPYGTGVVLGPAPGASASGPVHTFATTADSPTEPVAGIVPALDGTGFWIMESTPTADGSCRLRLVTTAQVAAAAVEHPCAFVPERETAAGIVGRVGSRFDPGSGRLLDLGTGAVTPLGGSLLGWADRRVVLWSRQPTDPLVVEDVIGGDQVEVELPPGRVTRQVALSDDGRYLAVVLVEVLLTVRSYEVWVHDLASGDARVATVTTVDGRPLDLAWQGSVLVVLGNGVDTYDAATGELYRSSVEPMPSRIDVVALPPGNGMTPS